MDGSEWLDLAPSAAPLRFTDRFELAKAHCALVFESRGGKLTDVDVAEVARQWADGPAAEGDRDADLLAAYLFAWLG